MCHLWGAELPVQPKKWTQEKSQIRSDGFGPASHQDTWTETMFLSTSGCSTAMFTLEVIAFLFLVSSFKFTIIKYCFYYYKHITICWKSKAEVVPNYCMMLVGEWFCSYVCSFISHSTRSLGLRWWWHLPSFQWKALKRVWKNNWAPKGLRQWREH